MSSSTGNRGTSAVKGGTGTTPTPANSGGASGRRRSSGSGAFAGLMGQKRNSSDEAAAARKASFDEQKPAVGFIGSMWNSFTRGSGSNPNAGSKQQEKP